MAIVDEMIVSLTRTSCCACGIVFSMPSEYMQARRNDHRDFYCPSGHILAFRAKSEAERLKEQLEQANRVVENERRSKEFWRDESQAKDRKLSAARGVLTRTKNRVAAGVCPCCNRTFASLGRHMRSKHPEYGTPAPEAS